MDIQFCKHYKGDGHPPSNQYCRFCPNSIYVCDKLWKSVINLSKINDGNSVTVYGTNAVLFPNPKNPNLVYLRINAQWSLSKEDFLHFVSTGNAKIGRADDRQNPDASPSLTRQEPYVQVIIEMIGGWNLPELVAVKKFQQNNHKIQKNSISGREKLIRTLEDEKNKLFGNGSPESQFKMSVIKKTIKLLREGKSEYEIIRQFNRKYVVSGHDVRPILVEIGLMIKNFEIVDNYDHAKTWENDEDRVNQSEQKPMKRDNQIMVIVKCYFQKTLERISDWLFEKDK